MYWVHTFAEKMAANARTLALVYALVCASPLTVCSVADPEENVYSFTVKDIRGKDVSLSDYKGKVSS